MNGDDAIARMLAQLRSLPALVGEVVPDVAEIVREELEKSVAAGTTPEGESWAAKKRGGGKPLASATKHVRVAAMGTRVFVALRGHVARHHKGRAKGGTVRAVIPRGRTPARMAKRIRALLAERFASHMGRE